MHGTWWYVIVGSSFPCRSCLAMHACSIPDNWHRYGTHLPNYRRISARISRLFVECMYDVCMYPCSFVRRNFWLAADWNMYVPCDVFKHIHNMPVPSDVWKNTQRYIHRQIIQLPQTYGQLSTRWLDCAVKSTKIKCDIAYFTNPSIQKHPFIHFWMWMGGCGWTL